MAAPKKIPNRISLRVKAGSALERVLKASEATPTGALHDLAAAYEALKRS